MSLSRSMRLSSGRRSPCSSTSSPRRRRSNARPARSRLCSTPTSRQCRAPACRAGAAPRRAASGGDHPVAADGALPGPYDARSRAPTYVSGDIEAITGFTFEDVSSQPGAVCRAASSRRPQPRHRRDRGAAEERPFVDRISLAMRRRQLQAFPRPGRAVEGRRRAAGRVCRHPDRHFRTALARKPADPGTENGCDRQADRRHRARLQQSAGSRDRRARTARQEGLARRGAAPDPRHDQARRRAGQRAGPAPARLRPPPEARAASDRARLASRGGRATC